MPVQSPRSGRDIDLFNQREDIRKKLDDPNLSYAEKRQLYDQGLRIDNALGRISNEIDPNDLNISQGIIDQINDQDVPIGQPVDQFLNEKQNAPKEKEKPVDPEKYKDQGGPAIKPKRKGLFGRAKENQEEAGERLKDKAEDQLKKQGLQGVQQTARQFAKQAFNATKKFFVQLATKNPWVLVIGGVLILVLLIVLIFWGIAMSNGSKMPNSNGTTFVQAADPIKDQTLITKILHLSGDTTINKKELQEVVSLLTAAKSYANADTAQKIDILVSKINALGELNAKNGQDIITSLKEIVDSLNPCAQVASSGFYKFVYDENSESAKRLFTGKAKRPTGEEINVDTRVCGILATIENNKTQIGISSLQITAIANHHDDSGAGPANHWDGRAVDIDSDTTTLSKVMQWIVSNQSNLTSSGMLPAQVIGPDENNVFWVGRGSGKAARYSSDTLSHHKNHVHIGFTTKK